MKKSCGKMKRVNTKNTKNSGSVNIKLAAVYVFAVILFTIFVSWIVLAKTISVETDDFNDISGNAIQLVKVPQVSPDSQLIVLIGAIISVLILIFLIIFLVKFKND